jgi:hypothetical protein
MNTVIRLEETSMLIGSFFMALLMGFEWWMFPLFLFAPDISMLGYLLGNKIGSFIYNAIHFKLLGIAISILGYLISTPTLTFAGLILFGHSSLDRIFGYGLKHSDDFKHTHLGVIQKSLNKK